MVSGEAVRPTLHPAFIQRALDAEAEAWARETDVDAWLAKFSSDPRTVAKLREITLLAFAEGLFRGASNVISGKPLAVTVEEAMVLEAERISAESRALAASLMSTDPHSIDTSARPVDGVDMSGENTGARD